MEHLSLADLVLTPLYLVVLLGAGFLYARRKSNSIPEFKYFVPALSMKLLGGIAVALVYTVYYPGGDTTSYFHDSIALQNLLLKDPGNFYSVYVNEANRTNIFFFDADTGIPVYSYDNKAWTVVRISFFIVACAMRSFVVSSMLSALVSFIGVWQMYRVFALRFPDMKREMAIAFLFIPSVFFWGSGLLKDSFTLGALGLFIWAFYTIVEEKRLHIGYIFIILFSANLIVSIKPYILVGLIPALIVWFFQKVSEGIKAPVLRFILVPVISAVGFSSGLLLMTLLGDALAEYSLENIIEKAIVTNQDLKQDYYQGNSFDIGEFDGTLPSLLSKFPAATFAAIFRPLIFESNNFVMLVSGLENFFILLFALRFLVATRIIGWTRMVLSDELIAFSFVFALLFAFAVGLSTSNFGSLVRYKIPCIPFFIASLFILRKKYQDSMSGSVPAEAP